MCKGESRSHLGTEKGGKKRKKKEPADEFRDFLVCGGQKPGNRDTVEPIIAGTEEIKGRSRC